MWKYVLTSTGWACGLYGILNAESVLAPVIGGEHSICGAWGCGPPVESLIVWHIAVCWVLIPAGRIAVRCCPVIRFNWVAMIAGLTLALLLIFVTVDTLNWWQTASSFGRQFVLRRVLFATVAYSDVPVASLAISVVAIWRMAGRRMTHTPETGDPETTGVSSRAIQHPAG